MVCNLSGRHPRDKPEHDGNTVFTHVANPVCGRTPHSGGQSPTISRLSSFRERSGCIR
ncbi:hypothetical protein N434_00895 [Rhizobium sp. UGM030330-04]|nr:hypothetical protein N434_00895 [Rhizobium sp. UGM030330-04]